MSKKLPTFTSHVELRKRSSFKCTKPSKTDQSFKQTADINNIIKAYTKTGVLPNRPDVGRYVDNTIVPTLEGAFNASKSAVEAFYQLPATIRKLMDNDPSKLESFILDESNHKLLIEHGLMKAKEKAQDSVNSSEKTSMKKEEKNEVSNPKNSGNN